VLVPFADYAFTKAHAAAYGLVSYWTAYLKANYPAEYMAGLLTSVAGDPDRSALYLNECRRMGIKVLPPDVNASAAVFTAVGTDIRFGLAAIRNVGTAVVAAVLAARQPGGFASFSDFLRKAPVSVSNKRVIESLIKAGAFDSLGHPRRGLMLISERAVDSVLRVKRSEAMGQDSLFGADPASEVTFDVPVPAGDWDKSTMLAFEREMLGLYVSDHPLLGRERALERVADCSVAELLASGDGRVATVAGLLSGVRRKITRQGAAWATATLEDLEGAIEVLFFPATYERYAGIIAETGPASAGPADDAIIVVRGRLDRSEEAPRLVAMEVDVADLG
jgi:DNA polymerase III subunit alpha